MEAFPSTWRDTPKNRERWIGLQKSYLFLTQEQASKGELQCYYCGAAPLRIVHWSEPQQTADKATVDHVVPRSRGGADDPSNMVVSCVRCNYAKGTGLPR